MKKRGYAIDSKRLFLLHRFVPALLFAIIACTNCFAQKISARLERDKIVIGEQVILTLQVNNVDPRLYFIANWFELPDSVNHLAIVKKDSVDTSEAGGFATYMQHITLTSFDSGHWAIPLQPIVVQNRETGKKTILKADSVFLSVLPADVSNLKDYHDIKDIIDVPAKTDYTLIIAAAISVAIIIILVILIARRKKKPVKVEKKPLKSARPPLEEALYTLNALDKEGLPFSKQHKLFFTRVDDICREYFANRLDMHVTELTSNELLQRLAVYLQANNVKSRYTQLLRMVDAVKFARYEPQLQEHTEALQSAAFVLQQIEDQIKITKGHAN